MGCTIAEQKRRMIVTGAVVSVSLLASGCQGSRSPVEEMAHISTAIKFDSKTFGVPASPRVTTSRRVRKGGGRSQIGKPYKVRGKWYYPKDEPGYVNTGISSWYGPNFHGRLTANGEIYDMYALSAAHKTFPLPSYAMVTNLTNGNRVMVRVNDRGPYAHGREIDVSSRAADLLDFKTAGTAKVKVEYIGRAPLEGDDTQMLMASFQRGDGLGPSADTVMVAAADRSHSAVYRPAHVAFNGRQTALPGVRPLDQLEDAQPAAGAYLGHSVPIPTSPAFTSSYGPIAEAQGTRDVFGALTVPDMARERIAIGVVDVSLLEKIRRLALGKGRLVEEVVPATALVSVSLVVDSGTDVDAMLRRLWQAGADEAFVVRG